ncbi:hypothetical protein [Haladaptatus sp. ZSTT2]|uniref:hypothetical protein n=1 Tax=Haladaptatus sp. ZSTT2 TaxID=3120515 RepID=UPI00300F09E5
MEGQPVLFLYRPAGENTWHIIQPGSNDGSIEDTEVFRATAYRGIEVQGTFIRSEANGELRFAEERQYRVLKSVLDNWAELYVLVCHEVNEESVAADLWEVENAVAYNVSA